MAAPVYCTAVLEYLCAELMELAGNAARDNKKHRINPRHILLAIANDEELHRLLKGVTISQGGVLPHIPEVLLYKRSQWGKLKSASASKTSPSVTIPASPKPAKVQKTVTVAPKKPPAKKLPPKKPAASKRKSVPKKKKAQKDDNSSGADTEEETDETTPTSGSVTVLSEKMLDNGQKLTVLQGDIARVQCDAVIHPTNANCSLAGLVGRALRAAGGAKLEKECNMVASQTSMSVTEAVMSGAGNLPCRHVIHVNSPNWSTDKGVDELKKTVENALQLAEDKQLESLAFPSVASGSNNFPKQVAAQTILRTLKRYFTSSVESSITQVYFVLYDMESIGVYTTELVRMDSY